MLIINSIPQKVGIMSVISIEIYIIILLSVLSSKLTSNTSKTPVDVVEQIS